MTRRIADAELRIFAPETSSPKEVIRGDDLESASLQERGQGEIDQGSFSIPNHAGEYDPADITSGDRLEFYLKLAGETGLKQYWTATAKPPSLTLDGGTRRQIELGARDFVAAVLSWRRAYRDFEDSQISGSQDSIVETLLRDNAPEIDRSQIAEINQETDIFANGRTVRTILVEDVAPVGDAIISQDGTALVFEPLPEITTKHPVTPEDFRGSIEISGSDSDLATLVRVNGGTAHEVDDEQLTQSATERVTETSRKTVQIQTRKSEVDRVQVWVDRDTSSQDDLVARLQSDRGGSPVEPDNRESDIVTKTLSPEFLADGDLTTFIFPTHTLAPGENPFLIVEASGSTGHLVGVDGSGTLTFQAEYPYPVLTNARDKAAADEYRRRDHRIQDDRLDSFPAVRDSARSYLRQNNSPARTISVTAESLRAHRLQPGEVVSVNPADWPQIPTSGPFVVVQRSTSLSPDARLATELELQEAGSI